MNEQDQAAFEAAWVRFVDNFDKSSDKWQFRQGFLAALAHRDAQAQQVNRQMLEALQRANSQAEHFEREWYLRGDEVERLEAVNQQILDALRKAEESIGRFVSEEGSSQMDFDALDDVTRAIAAAEAKGGV